MHDVTHISLQIWRQRHQPENLSKPIVFSKNCRYANAIIADIPELECDEDREVYRVIADQTGLQHNSSLVLVPENQVSHSSNPQGRIEKNLLNLKLRWEHPCEELRNKPPDMISFNLNF